MPVHSTQTARPIAYAVGDATSPKAHGLPRSLFMFAMTSAHGDGDLLSHCRVVGRSRRNFIGRGIVERPASRSRWARCNWSKLGKTLGSPISSGSVTFVRAVDWLRFATTRCARDCATSQLRPGNWMRPFTCHELAADWQADDGRRSAPSWSRNCLRTASLSPFMICQVEFREKQNHGLTCRANH